MSQLFDDLVQIFARLRNPEDGCPWDLKQTPDTLREYIIEEAHELTEAISDGDVRKQKEELGDLFLQVLFLSRIMEEKNHFDINDVMKTLKEKLIRRHPHIFQQKMKLTDDQVKNNWEKIKKKEKSKESIISDYPDTMPALSVSKRISEQAASVGFDWPDSSQIHGKINEELNEILKAKTIEEKNEECGDLLFAVVNLCRHLRVHPELALKAANRKFTERFRYLENKISDLKQDITSQTLPELEALWQESKFRRQ